jgi:PPOX class probable F420-dependent enzyme
VRKRLVSARVGRMATLDAQHRPHLVPICFAYDGSVFYTAVDRKPKKVAPTRLARLKNIRGTPQVSLLIDEYNDNDWTHLWYVMVRGGAKLISSQTERKHALSLLRKKYRQYAAGMLPDDAPIVCIRPRKVIAWGKI